MGAKQSSPTAANGRTRAYSGGDLPSSSGGGGGANGTGGRAAGGRYPHLAAAPHGAPGGSAAAATGGAAGSAPRSRSLGGAGAAAARAAQSAFNIPHSSGPYGPRLVIGSLPAHLSPHLFGGKGGPAGGRRGERGWGDGLSVPIEAGARLVRWEPLFPRVCKEFLGSGG